MSVMGAGWTDTCYVGRKGCGCLVAASVIPSMDNVEEMAATLKEVAKWKRDGLTITVVDTTQSEVRIAGCRCGQSGKLSL